MTDTLEIWITVDCTKVVKTALLNRGIAMGNEYRFDEVSWKILVTRTADLFLDVLRRAVEHRILRDSPDLQLVWRTAIGSDELLLVPPPAEDRQRLLPRVQQVMALLRGLLYEKKFIGTALRAVLMEMIDRRAEEKILAGRFDREATVAKLADKLNAMDLDKEGAAAAVPAEPAAPTEPAASEEPAPPDEPPDEEPADEESAEPDEGPAKKNRKRKGRGK